MRISDWSSDVCSSDLEAGITRDSIAVDWTFKGRALRLVDTAGLRRKARVVEKLERLSTQDALRSIRFAQVVVLLLDVEEGLEKQDLTIARMGVDEGDRQRTRMNYSP